MDNAQKLRKEIRQAVADYIRSEGCSCCQGDEHGDDRARLAKLLGVRKEDGYYSFTRYQTPRGK